MSGRMTTAFGYITAFAGWIMLWWLIVLAFEFMWNVLLTEAVLIVFTNATVPVADLPTPMELLTDGLANFPALWNIGNTIFWGFVEEILFGLTIIFGVLGALLVNDESLGSPIRAIGKKLQELMVLAGTRRKETRD